MDFSPIFPEVRGGGGGCTQANLELPSCLSFLSFQFYKTDIFSSLPEDGHLVPVSKV